MSISVKIFLVIFICISFLDAKELYTKENIKKHLETIFKKEIQFEKKNKFMRYNFFKKEVVIYYEFSKSIQNQKEKVLILQKVIDRFEKLLPNLTFKLQYGKPNIKVSNQNTKKIMTINSLDSIIEEFIHYSFLNKTELLNELKKGYWHEKYIAGQSPENNKKVIDSIKKAKASSIGSTGTTLIFLNVFRLIEIDNERSKYFTKLIEKELYFSLLIGMSRWKNSLYIQPSVFNDEIDDFSKKNQISKFDWILLDEFYNNKKLEIFMFYKTEAIPILTEAIYKRINKVE